jgi:uncharacterized membrane protein
MVTSIFFILFALGGCWFAGVSTYDFFLHLDGQVHSISCSYVPGAARDELGTSGCYAVMMSPYSSVMRDYTWGGIPIALPGLAVFIYMVFIGLEHLILGRHKKRAEAAYLVVASLLPLVTSIAYYYISVTKVGEVCKMCVGIYTMSIGLFLAAVVQLILSKPEQEPGPNHLRNQFLRYLLYFAEGLLCVGLAVVVYLNVKPVYKDRNCGELVQPEDRASIMLAPIGGGETPAVEVLDPLCPSCNVFRNRLDGTEVSKKLAMKTVLFPLDSECNWMLKEPVHYGSCMVSRAILCASDPQKVIDWALANNMEIRNIAKEKGPEALRAKILEQFGEVGTCIDTAETKQKLNLNLRWIMSNSLPMLTPQLYVNNRRLCDEDMDLGLEYGLGRLLNASVKTEGGK